jgi:DNA (cytosine-5)-methyltransferase 1
VIFWGAKRGVPLPQFPVPMYAFPAGALRCTLPTGGKLPPPTRSKAGDFHQFAPLRPISVNDAIGDLVRIFEYSLQDICAELPLPKKKPPFDW